MKSGISVIIPVYRSEKSVGAVVERLLRVLPTCASDYEIILVEDGSPDNSWATLEALAQQHPQVRALRFMRNFGQHNALLCGVLHATFDLCVTMDDDQQHPPESIPTLIAALHGDDVVYGTPDEEQYSSLMRRLATQVTKLVLQPAMGKDASQNIAPFRLFRTELRQAFQHFSGHYVNIDVLLTWGTSKFTHVPVQYAKRAIGQSNYTLSKLITHTLNLLTGFSTLPLRIASLLGIGLTLFGVLLMIYILIIRVVLFGEYEVPGFTFLASVISIFAGSQMFILGIMGEYLARMYFRVMEKPVFVIKSDTRTAPE